MKLDDKMENWLETSNNEFSNQLKELSNNHSIKSNFIVTNYNFSLIKRFIINLLEYIKYLRKNFDSDSIAQEVLEGVQNKKLVIPINYNIEVGEKKYIEIGNYQFVIHRKDDYTVIISRKKKDGEIVDPSEKWNTSNLIICVKIFDGTIVYPIIKTQDDTIELVFNDKLSTNYNVYIL